MLEELNGKYQALLQEKRALEVRLSRAEKAPERNREPGETSANPDVNPTAERQRTSRETRNPANPEPSAGDSRLTTVLERLLESRESPKVEKYYELPKVMDKPANLGELRAWIEALRTYVPNVKTVGTMGLEKFLEGRMKGHIKRITEKQVAKLKAAGTFQENLDSYVRIWCKQFGLDDDDDWARKKLKELSFNGGSPAEFMVKIEAIFDEMVKDPLSARDKVQTFFNCVKIPSLVQLWKYNPTTGRPWTGDTQWDELYDFIMERYGTTTVDEKGQERSGVNRHLEKKRAQEAPGGPGGSDSNPTPSNPQGFQNKKFKDGKGGAVPRGANPKKPQAQGHGQDHSKGAQDRRPEERKPFRIPPGECQAFYKARNLDFRCGEPFGPGHELGKCTKRPAFPKDLPAHLKKQIFDFNKKK